MSPLPGPGRARAARRARRRHPGADDDVRGVPSKVSWLTVLPRNAWATSWPTAASVRPARGGALRSTVTSIRGAVSARPLVTSVTPGMADIACWTSRAASLKCPSGAGVYLTSSPSPPEPPVSPKLISPASVSLPSWSRRAFSTAAVSCRRAGRASSWRGPYPHRRRPRRRTRRRSRTHRDLVRLDRVESGQHLLDLLGLRVGRGQGVPTGSFWVMLTVFCPALSMKLVSSRGRARTCRGASPARRPS